MKVLFALILLGAAWAVCNLRTDCAPSLLQQPQQQLSMSQMGWANSFNAAVFASVNQVMEKVFTQLYGEEEGDVMMVQLETCERTRENSLLGFGLRMSLLGAQLFNICKQEDPNLQGNRIFSQFLSAVFPLIAPCTLDRDIMADLVLAEISVLSEVRQSNVTGFEAGSQAILNMTERIFTFTDGLIANFSNSIQSLTERNLLDDAQAPQIIELLQMTVSSVEQVFRDLLTDMPDNPSAALANAENSINQLEQNIEVRLRSLNVPTSDVQSLSETLRNITSEVTTVMTEVLTTQDTESESSLPGFTRQMTALMQENAQILVDLVAQNIDEFCAAQNSTSTNST